MQKTCKNCKNKFETNDKRRIFCCRSCSTVFNNTGSEKSENTKQKISESLKSFHEENPIPESKKAKHQEWAAGFTKGKFKSPKSILEVSSRTVSKIFKRLNVGCSQCGWNETACDIHHIDGRKIKDADNHKNLTYLCPNCHRKCHVGLLKKDDLINLNDYIGDKWKDFYFG